MSVTFSNAQFSGAQSSTGVDVLGSYTGANVSGALNATAITINGTIDKPLTSTVSVDINAAGIVAVGAPGTYLGYHSLGSGHYEYYFSVNVAGLSSPVIVGVSGASVPPVETLVPITTSGIISAPLDPSIPSSVPGPALTAATVDQNSLVLTYNEALDAGHPPSKNQFNVTAGGAAVAVTGVKVSGSTVTLTLASSAASGQAVTVAYADPTSGNDVNAVQDTAGNDAASVAATAVLNTTPASLISITNVSGGTNVVDHVVTGSVDKLDAGSTVTLYDGSSALGTATSDANGNWSIPFVYSQDGSSANLKLTATETDALGLVIKSSPITLALDYSPNQGLFGSVIHSAATAGGEVYDLYEGLLGRAPDPVGGEDFAQELSSGTALDQVTQNFLDSAEGQSHFAVGSSDADFVSQLYQTVLGRAGDAAGAQGWQNALASGESRADVADSFVFSAEHVAQLQPALDTGVYMSDSNASDVARLYYGLLGRAPDPTGLQGQTAAFDDGATLNNVASTFLSSTEYQSHYAGTSDQAFVNDLYQNALGRAPDAAGGAGWVGALAGGESRADVAIGIAESSEAQTHLAGRIEAGFQVV